MPDGIIIIDKPTGWTSMDVCAKLRGILREKRIGHAGTLDPMATGVLPVFVGRATKAVQFAENGRKEYRAVLKLGTVTDTQDTTGAVLEAHPVTVGADEVRAALEHFTGELLQLPPMYSALKVNGQKLYDLARQGKTVERKPRAITVYELELLEQSAPDEFALRVVCSKGTYIRTLCQDLGQALGCGGCMAALRRTMAAGFRIEEAVTLERAQEELAAIRQGDYPAVATYVEHFDDYDTVFIGYPIWYGSMASPMQAFLYAHASELAGKRIALFATSGSSGVSASVGEARSLCPDAEFTEVLHLTQNTLEETEPRVTAWLERLEANDNDSEEPMQTNTLELTVEGSTFTATLEENSSTQALKERLAQGPLSIRMSDYGDMEKVGSLGISLPRNDRQTTTGPGDLILYQGDSFVIYYDTNSWNFTRLGRVDGVATREEMLDLLGGVGEITVTLSL